MYSADRLKESPPDYNGLNVIWVRDWLKRAWGKLIVADAHVRAYSSQVRLAAHVNKCLIVEGYSMHTERPPPFSNDQSRRSALKLRVKIL